VCGGGIPVPSQIQDSYSTNLLAAARQAPRQRSQAKLEMKWTFCCLLALQHFASLRAGDECDSADLYLSAENGDVEADLMKVSLLQTRVLTPSSAEALFQEGEFDTGIWDTLGGMLHKAEKEAGEVQKNVLDTIVTQTDAVLDELDKAVNKMAADAEEAETKFVNYANVTVQEQVELVKKKVASVMDKCRVFWHEYRQQAIRLQHIVVGTLSMVGQTDTAIKLNSTFVGVLSSIDNAADTTLAVAKAARSVVADSASCSVLSLNATLSQATDRVTIVTKDFDDFFQLVDEKFQAFAKKLPEALVAQSVQAVEEMRKRGLETSANLLRVYNNAAQKQIKVINRLQEMCVAEGKACGEGGLFSNIKNFFKHLFRH